MIKTPEDLMNLHAETLSASQAAATRALEGFGKLAELNLKTAGEALAQTSDQLKALFTAKDPQQASRVISEMAKPSTEALTAWAKEIYQLSSQTGVELSSLAEKQITDGNKQLLAAVELLAKNAPAGSEGVVQVLRTTIATASTTYDQVFKATRQLADQAQAGVAAATKAAGRKSA
jgi:phasin family protein